MRLENNALINGKKNTARPIERKLRYIFQPKPTGKYGEEITLNFNSNIMRLR